MIVRRLENIAYKRKTIVNVNDYVPLSRERSAE